jgi:hypothetical protein
VDGAVARPETTEVAEPDTFVGPPVAVRPTRTAAAAREAAGMKKILEVGGFLLFLWGAAGVAHELTGWFRLWGVVDRLAFLDGHELYASIVLAVLGGALMVASDRFR